MTHDELIAYIDDSTDGLKHKDIFPLLLANTQALRAAVELHKPNKVPKGLWCTECSKRFENSGWYEPYPCPTIRAIEEQLK